MVADVGVGEGERQPPLAPKPARITVKVFVDDLPAGEVEGDRATEFEARELCQRILAEVEALLQEISRAH